MDAIASVHGDVSDEAFPLHCIEVLEAVELLVTPYEIDLAGRMRCEHCRSIYFGWYQERAEDALTRLTPESTPADRARLASRLEAQEEWLGKKA